MPAFIMSGLPGSGKSTWVEQCQAAYKYRCVCSADSYFVNEQTKKYEFDGTKIGEAHAQCLREFAEYVSTDKPTSRDAVFVDNTNLMAWEIAPYYALAEAYGWEPTIVFVQRLFSECVVSNIHDVPLRTMERMVAKQRRESFPPHWRAKVVNSRNDKVFTTGDRNQVWP